MTKIRGLQIEGLRGVKRHLDLQLQSESALIYGDNGSGKSTISDVIEWFYSGRVDHLSKAEIGPNGIDALRHVDLDETATAYASLEFNDTSLSNKRILEVEGDKLVTRIDKPSQDFELYLKATEREKIIFRYRDLVRFVTARQNERLRELFEIIGFSEVTKIRDALQKSRNNLSRDVKNKDFENQIAHQQRQIVEQLNQNVTSDQEMIEIFNGLVKPFGFKKKIVELSEIDDILERIKRPDDSDEMRQETFLTELKEGVQKLPARLEQLRDDYKEYKNRFDALVQDLDKLKDLYLRTLLQTGESLLEKEQYDKDVCPLCEEAKDRKELLTRLKERLVALEEIKKENQEFRNAKQDVDSQITGIKAILESLVSNSRLALEGNKDRKSELDSLLGKLSNISAELEIKLEPGNSISEYKAIKIGRKNIKPLVQSCKSDLKNIREKRSKDPKWDAQSKIGFSISAYRQIGTYKAERKIMEAQRNAVDHIYRTFVAAQRTALVNFLTSYSARITELYNRMSPHDNVDNIRLTPVDKNGELNGISIIYDFRDEKDASPPEKYLSESRLNCLGLAIFLTSVEVFNKKNKFFLLDDVISSFDSDHRKRFADLIIEEYGSFQVILLTHERSWFEIVKVRAKQKGWQLHGLRHVEKDGTQLTSPPRSLRKRIEDKIAAKDKDGLGNEARIYLEDILKRLAGELDLMVVYRSNDRNEERMPYELLTALKQKVKKVKCKELLNEAVIDRLLASTNIGNKDSHSYFAEMSFGDIRGFWDDIVEFEALVKCKQCGSTISLKYYDRVEKRIRCKKKGELEYTWEN